MKPDQRGERCSVCGVVLGDMERAMAETNRLWRAINGMDIDDADKRAEVFMHMHLDGLTVTEHNRATVKSALAEHFADLMRAGDETGRL
jgi:hypothetical protein